ncbi:alpha/beta fold hydrolase [Streptomyces solisilvae]|uniref:alpha/beta fold hydrolase n=1 Tax=Streptomyces malaysiensis TaxID=92644 RepID=UPI0020C7222A|nr:alpha/beta hydrolase [Streptomyces samsunensis]
MAAPCSHRPGRREQQETWSESPAMAVPSTSRTGTPTATKPRSERPRDDAGHAPQRPHVQLDHVEAACQLLDALGIEKAAFVGNSMGGHTSLRLAAERPERVSHLITMGPPIQMKPFLFGAGGGPTEGLKIMYQTYTDATPEGMRRLVEIMVYDKARFATPELCRLRSEAALKRPEHLHNIASAAPKAPIPIWIDPNQVSGITAPSLLIHGRDDRVVSFESTLFLAANIPNSRAHLINRCGHWAQLEHADEFNRLVVDFVTNN